MKNLDSINPKINSPAPKTPAFNRPAPVAPTNLPKAKNKGRGGKILKWFLTLLTASVIILIGAAAIRADNLSQKIFVGQKTTFLEKIAQVMGMGGNQTLSGENLSQINILILGIGGEGHDGPYLTDTMILAQIRPDIGEVTLTSIPRDYWVTLPDGGMGKINEAFSDGYIKNYDWNEAGQSAITAVQNLTGLQIPYFAVLDFSGFEKAIDSVGGVDVTVDRTFTDYAYPDDGADNGYLPPQTFIAGPQHMDGARALIFARSRHAAGVEGSDFARSQRQQKIIDAFKQKVLSENLVSGISTVNNLLNIVADHFHTNISPAEMLQLYNLTKNNNMNILSLSLDPDTYLICPEILASDGAYILTPCPGKSDADIQNFFKNSFAIAKLKDENATVWLASSTGDTQAYNTAFRDLTDAGLTVYQLNYSLDKLPQTIYYQVNPKPATAEFIGNELNATAVTLPPPGVTPDKNKVDVIVVLGQNAPTEPPPTPYVAPPAQQPAGAIPQTSTTTAATSS